MQAVDESGYWYVRIDDIDPPRTKPGAIRDILSQLESFGFFRRDNGGLDFENRDTKLSTSTTAITLQSHSTERYWRALDHLISKHAVYACDCSRKQLGKQTIYPGICRDRQLPLSPSGNHLAAHTDDAKPDNSSVSAAIRFRVPDKNTQFRDRVFETIEQNVARAVGDFIIKRRDGLWGYQLATVVDDWHDEVTEVVRGADLLYNTPRQIALITQLGFRQPNFLHVPVAVDCNGQKLSKQTLAEPVDADNPLPALKAAWKFLGQSIPAKCETIAHFWQHAELSWDYQKIPATQAIEAQFNDFR